MTTFLALYRGKTISEAQLVSVSTDPSLIAAVTTRLLETREPQGGDPVMSRLARGRRAALRLIHREVDHVNEA